MSNDWKEIHLHLNQRQYSFVKTKSLKDYSTMNRVIRTIIDDRIKEDTIRGKI